MKTIIVVFLAFAITAVLYRLRYRKEQQKIANLKSRFEQNREYSTPLFNNAGFVVGGIIMFGLGLLSTMFKVSDPGYGMPLGGGIGLSLFGLFMVYQTTYIRIKSDVIEFQPLLFKISHINFSNKVVTYNNISKVTKKDAMPGTPFVMLNLYTKDSKKYKLNMGFYNSEVGNTLYEFLNGKISHISN